ncbi:IPP transferase family protein [Neorickettsia helminthoeca str. Oregon]|uniref:tRNA dimethylallyltransferase n=1 Tax=Neorickettsia helminthoeca str. Oregon TaxID=1286528 RepID=X5HKC8_9RICK|nr:tRNA dimethylallyltransferase [Neorickettsia helminthoeca]AHX11489.1 IPP transferase family protein [Neorickettsia helminthoeca str. Oregon]
MCGFVNSRRVLVLTGPTSAGKTAIACSLHQSNEIFTVINADSKQVYKEVPVLTSQAPADSGLLYGYLSVFSSCRASVFEWMRDCADSLETVWMEGKIPLVVGGTPMYIYSLIHGVNLLPSLPPSLLRDLSLEYDRLGSSSFLSSFVAGFNLDISLFPSDKYKLVRDVAYLVHTGKTIQQLYDGSTIFRVPYSSIEVVSVIPESREVLYSRINERFVEALDSGAMDEVKALIQDEEIYKNPAVTTICGFREIASYLRSEISFEQMVSKSQQSIRHYAKRQLTWFRNKFSGMKVFGDSEGVRDYILRKYCA